MSQDNLWMFSVIIGLSVVTVVARSFFFLSNQDCKFPIGRKEVCNTHRLPPYLLLLCQKL